MRPMKQVKSVKFRLILTSLIGVVLCLSALSIAFFLPKLHPAKASVAATTYYVKVGGSPYNNGLSPATPFPTIQQAANLTKPGDTVSIMNGTYTEGWKGSGLAITRSGTPGAYITYMAYPGQHPILRGSTSAWNILAVNKGASYIIIEGLTVEGNSANLNLADALANKDQATSTYNTNGISIGDNDAKKISTHVIVRNNLVYNCPAGGIGAVNADYLTFDNNTVHSNSWFTRYATSGISILTPYNSDSYTGYKMFIRGNVTYDNETRVPWGRIKAMSDGNGIIIDTNLKSATGAPYAARTLVENNLSYDNGGSGIHSYHSQHVDIINNTAYNNSRSPALNYGSIFASSSNDVKILNNILYVRSGKTTNTRYADTNVTYDYNLYYNGLKPEVMGAHDIVANPCFVHPGDDFTQADFHLQQGSPAIGSGTSILAPTKDLAGNARPGKSGYDRGAYEVGTSSNNTGSPTGVITATNYALAPGSRNEANAEGGVGGGQDVGYNDDGDYLSYHNVNLGSGVNTVNVRFATRNPSTTNRIEFHLDSVSGPLIGTLKLHSTGGWQKWATQTTTITGASGVHSVYLVFKGGRDLGLGNIHWFSFSKI